MNRIHIGSTTPYLKHSKLANNAWPIDKLDVSGDHDKALWDHEIQQCGNYYNNLINKSDFKVDKEDEYGYGDDYTLNPSEDKD